MRRGSGSRLAAAVLGAGLLAAAAPAGGATRTVLLRDGFGSLPAATTWTDGQSLGAWTVRFAGYGGVTAIRAGSLLRLAPRPATRPDETHAALVVTGRSFAEPCLSVSSPASDDGPAADRLRAEPVGVCLAGVGLHQQRPLLLPGGEAQRLGAGQAGPRVPRRAAVPRHRIDAVDARGDLADGVESRGPSPGATTVRLDGAVVARFTDLDRPYTAGRVGLYSEDAVVDVDTVTVVRC